MAAPSAAELLHLVDRAEAGRLLPAEARLLRDGITALAAAVARVQALAALLPPDPGGNAETAAAHAAGWNDAIDRVQTELARPAVPATEETDRA